MAALSKMFYVYIHRVVPASYIDQRSFIVKCTFPTMEALSVVHLTEAKPVWH